jgi:hypothetical protein
MSTNSTSKKITKKSIKKINKDKISFIILSSVNGYKLSYNRYAPIIYYGTKPIVNYYSEEIEKFFPNSELLVISGKYTENFKLIKSNFSLIENQLYSVTGECENLRLGIQAARNNKIIVLKENSLVNLNYLVDKTEQFVYINSEGNNDAPGCIINENVVNNISFGVENNFINNCYLLNQSINKVFNYCSIEHNKNKMLHEAINHVLEDNFISIGIK